MAHQIKLICDCKEHEGLMDVSKEDHERVFGKLPEGKVCWLKIDRRLPVMTEYCLNRSNVVYTDRNGRNQLNSLNNKN